MSDAAARLRLMNTKNLVGLRVRAIRQRLGITQNELAAATQRSVETISAIERGKSLPNVQTLDRMASALGVPLRHFFDFGSGATNPKRAAALAEIDALLGTFSDKKLAAAAALLKTLSEH